MVNGTNGLIAETAALRGHGSEARDANRTSRVSELAVGSVESAALSPPLFLKQLQIEKRRADRTKSPLSLVLIGIDTDLGCSPAVIAELIELLGRSKRETDILGYVTNNRVGLLLPHTDEKGVHAFIRNLRSRISVLPTSVSWATYPDHLFDCVLNEPRQASDTIALLVEEQAGFGRAAAAVKRFVDIVGALVAIAVSSPIIVLTAIAIVATSPGPVIFRQHRIGKGGVPFVFYKFRSMRVDADDRIHREYVAKLIEGNLDEINLGDKDRPVYKMMRDPRVTPVGRVIRRMSIDELPQLFNVLKGDMSLVGPRPPLPYETERYQSWHLRRVLQVRPGITGLWQVEGRSTTSFDEMVRLDLRYIRSYSLWLDLKILAKTAMVVLCRKGAG